MAMTCVDGNSLKACSHAVQVGLLGLGFGGHWVLSLHSSNEAEMAEL